MSGGPGAFPERSHSSVPPRTPLYSGRRSIMTETMADRDVLVTEKVNALLDELLGDDHDVLVFVGGRLAAVLEGGVSVGFAGAEDRLRGAHDVPDHVQR